MKTVTLTSKNQITIPAKLVRELKWDKKRRLEVQRKGDALILTTELSAQERLEAHWIKVKPYIKRALTDEEIRQARREAHEERADRLMKRLREN